jgi:hypothetical protein
VPNTLWRHIFVWQSQRPEPVYRHKVMREFYYHDELNAFKKNHRPSGFVPRSFLKAAAGILFYAGIALLVPLIMVRRVLLDRRLRFLILCVLLLMAGELAEVFLFPHYLAPFTAAFYAIGLQAMRHLRLWKPGDQPVGMTLTRLIAIACVLSAGLRLGAEPLHLGLPGWPGHGAPNGMVRIGGLAQRVRRLSPVWSNYPESTSRSSDTLPITRQWTSGSTTVETSIVQRLCGRAKWRRLTISN